MIIKITVITNSVKIPLTSCMLRFLLETRDKNNVDLLVLFFYVSQQQGDSICYGSMDKVKPIRSRLYLWSSEPIKVSNPSLL